MRAFAASASASPYFARTSFPYLRSFKSSETSPDTIQYKIGEIFSGIQCKLTSGYVMRDVFDEVDNLRFQSSEDQHEMSSLYEIRISRMGNAGRNGGEYYSKGDYERIIRSASRTGK